MRVKELRLKNFRGFKEIIIKFPESNLLVLVGINGAGKSSILDCIAMFLSQFVAKLCNRDLNENDVALSENDINIDEEETINHITLDDIPDNPSSNCLDNVIEWSIGYNTIYWTIAKSHSGKHPGNTPLENNVNFDCFYKGLQEYPDQDIPVFTYIKTRRSFLENLPNQWLPVMS